MRNARAKKFFLVLILWLSIKQKIYHKNLIYFEKFLLLEYKSPLLGDLRQHLKLIYNFNPNNNI